MKCKPVKKGMWSNWHKTKAKLTHTYLGFDLHSPNVVNGCRYVWHYFKYRTWLEKRRFDLHNPDEMSLLFHGHNIYADRYKIKRK